MARTTAGRLWLDEAGVAGYAGLHHVCFRLLRADRLARLDFRIARRWRRVPHGDGPFLASLADQAGQALFAVMIKAAVMFWRSAVGLACLAVYGPFVVMAVYTSLFVSCLHCKTTAWVLLPCGPGLLPLTLTQRWLDLPRPGDTLGYILAMVFTNATVFALACLIRNHRRWGLAGIAVATVAFGALAFSTLAAIRA